MRPNPSRQPQILFVTSEVVFMPEYSGKNADYVACPTGKFANSAADFIGELLAMGVDVHVTQPDYRRRFASIARSRRPAKAKKLPAGRVHLTEDRIFFYTEAVDGDDKWAKIKISLAFQREVMHQVLPRVKPHLIHCHDWMTGLIPAVAQTLGIQCMFTVGKSTTAKIPLAWVEDAGIDAAVFWQQLFYDRFPCNYEETRNTNPLDLLLSGVFAADCVGVNGISFSPGRPEIRPEFAREPLQELLQKKWESGCAVCDGADPLNTQQYLPHYTRMLAHDIAKPQTRKSQSLRSPVPATNPSKRINSGHHQTLGNYLPAAEAV